MDPVKQPGELPINNYRNSCAGETLTRQREETKKQEGGGGRRESAKRQTRHSFPYRLTSVKSCGELKLPSKNPIRRSPPAVFSYSRNKVQRSARTACRYDSPNDTNTDDARRVIQGRNAAPSASSRRDSVLIQTRFMIHSPLEIGCLSISLG